jgi:hypothetical protein
MTKKSTALTSVNSGSDSDYDTFVNVDAETRFSTYISSKSFFTERGFIFSMDDANPMIPEEIATIINCLGWKKLAKQPQSFNAQMVKEFYANLTNPSLKKRQVCVRGKGVLYSKANINRFFGIKDEEDQYEATLATIN